MRSSSRSGRLATSYRPTVRHHSAHAVPVLLPLFPSRENCVLGQRRGVCFVDNHDGRFLASVDCACSGHGLWREVYTVVEKEKGEEKATMPPGRGDDNLQRVA